jgi:hypothetical protein
MKKTLEGMWFILPNGKHGQIDRLVGQAHVLVLFSVEPTTPYRLQLFRLSDLHKATFFHKAPDALAFAAKAAEQPKVDTAKAVPPEPPAGDAYQPAR